MMKRFFLPLLILVLFLALIWGAFFWDPAADREEVQAEPVVSTAPAGGDFILQSYRGAVSLESLRGKVVALYFGYTKCPDICPTSLGYLSLALNELSPAERVNVQALFISVDPDRDTVERLKDYGEYFHPLILGITGSPEQISDVTERYGAGYRKVKQDSAVGYVIDHTADTYVIDRQGKLRNSLSYGTPPSRILEVLRDLMQEG